MAVHYTPPLSYRWIAVVGAGFEPAKAEPVGYRTASGPFLPAHTEFGGRPPYRFHDERQSASGRWEMWMDATQARAVRTARHD